MNYKESKEMLVLIERSEKILLGCHRRPDPDCLGSVLALNLVLGQMGKRITITSPTEVADYVDYLPGFSKITTENYQEYDFSKHDLLITVDSSSWDMVLGDEEINSPEIPTVVIDHHKTNQRFGKINLVDDETSSCGEVIYRVFEDWNVEIDEDVANCLMAAIVGDTGGFRFPGAGARTFRVASQLMEAGANKEKTIFQILSSYKIETVKFWGEVLRNMIIDEKLPFLWSAIPYEIFKKFGCPVDGRETAATMFGQVIKESRFSFIAVEQEPGIITVSFRSRDGFDTSKIALELGGGGHVYASGATIENLPFNEAVEKVLQTVRKHAKE